MSTSALQQLRLITHRLDDNEERLLLAIDSADLGIWDWNVNTNKLVWDARMLDIFGITEDQFTGNIEIFEELVHPSDLIYVKRLIQEALTKSGKFSYTYRIKSSDFDYKFVSSRGKVLYDRYDKPYRMIGVAWLES